ncbi:hypothetical protein Y1Q_0001607 [Alligator mississippiensis]|uniref:Uncharacterized protein n=1 Tax=Alligator mississippiensis TaxID=8496 RepID=A0A151MA63_ALLMI|nr:hypothetical protein Y1Q_0001607 [Alligator mississippiensis]
MFCMSRPLSSEIQAQDTQGAGSQKRMFLLAAALFHAMVSRSALGKPLMVFCILDTSSLQDYEGDGSACS